MGSAGTIVIENEVLKNTDTCRRHNSHALVAFG